MSTAILGAEFRRTVRLARSYWLEYVSDLLLYTLGFLLLIAVFKAASASYGPQGYLSTLVGYTTWKICASILVDIAYCYRRSPVRCKYSVHSEYTKKSY